MKNINDQYKLINKQGMQINLMNYGATLTSLKIPDKRGNLVELTLGFDELEPYLTHPFYFGCTIGRVANRITNGLFKLNNKNYQLICNENIHSHLHGGKQGFDKIFWQSRQQDNSVTFSHLSAANEEYYPGNLSVDVTYELTDDNELKIHYHATTDQATPVNLTNHTYWNLRGAGNGDILSHELEIFSHQYVETNAKHLPTGRLLGTPNSPFDFRIAKPIGERIRKVTGYDHCYLLDGQLAARVREPKSGRMMEVHTTQPGMQFYSGNYLASYRIAESRRTNRWGAFCLETQGLPDAVNHRLFPSIILEPEQVYRHTTSYKFYF
ncbi:MAG: aldose epimerase family protein [Pseudomonadota bacterium]